MMDLSGERTIYQKACATSATYRQLADEVSTLTERFRFVQDLILSGFDDNPGSSDLDDEQPITVRMTLGDYRKVRNMR